VPEDKEATKTLESKNKTDDKAEVKDAEKEPEKAVEKSEESEEDQFTQQVKDPSFNAIDPLTEAKPSGNKNLSGDVKDPSFNFFDPASVPFVNGKGPVRNASSTARHAKGIKMDPRIAQDYESPEVGDVVWENATHGNTSEVANLTWQTAANMTVCMDMRFTNIRFKNGNEASCADLHNYCNAVGMEKEVQYACPLTCGLCRLRNLSAELMNESNESVLDCSDGKMHEKPTFLLSGSVASCKDLKAFCNTHPKRDVIRNKCRETCGMCASADGNISREVSPDVHPTSSNSLFGCGRRRRIGWCVTRRRRASATPDD